jgi:hypothetical protein
VGPTNQTSPRREEVYSVPTTTHSKATALVHLPATVVEEVGKASGSVSAYPEHEKKLSRRGAGGGPIPAVTSPRFPTSFRPLTVSLAVSTT